MNQLHSERHLLHILTEHAAKLREAAADPGLTDDAFRSHLRALAEQVDTAILEARNWSSLPQHGLPPLHS